jgi:hypothetical protein
MEYVYIGLIILFLVVLVLVGVTMDKEDLEK